MNLRIGRLSAQYGVAEQSAAFGLGPLIKASRLLPLTSQLKAGMAVMQTGFIKLSDSVGQEQKLRIEDRGDRLAYIAETCPICAGKAADEPICHVHSGALMQSSNWLTGQEFEIKEVACRAMGATACVWEVSKRPG